MAKRARPEPGSPPMSPIRWCGQTGVAIARREDGSGYDCTIGRGNQRWYGVVPLPFGIAEDGSPSMTDEIARRAVEAASSEGFDKRVNFDGRSGRFLIRRRESYDAPTY